jgi:hypothetical protein
VLPQLAPNQGKRSDIPDNVTPTSAQVTPTAFPLLAADSVLGKYFDARPSVAGAGPTPAELRPADINTLPFSLPGIANESSTPGPRLVSRVVNLAAPSPNNVPLLAPSQPNPLAATYASGTPDQGGSPPLATNRGVSSSRPLGIFSGQPMPDWPVPPPIFQPRDQPSPEDNELFQRWMRWVDG